MIITDPQSVARSRPKNQNHFFSFNIMNFLPDREAGIYCTGQIEISGSDTLRLNRFEGFIRFFRTSMPRRHLMQAFPHFGLAAVRTTF